METRTLTIMLTDIQGFTQRTSSTSRRALQRLLDEHERLLLPVVRHYGGTLIKTIGDALLVTFTSPTNAVLCGLAMQERLTAHNADRSEADRLNVRVAVNSGEVQIRDGDIFGEAVNIAARIEGITDPGEIYFTEAVYLAMNKAEVPSSEVGEKRLKGLPEAIKVYKVIRDPLSEQYRELRDEMLGLELDESMRPEIAVGRGGEADGPTPAGSDTRPRSRVSRRGVWISIAATLVLAIGLGAAAYVILRDPMAEDLATLQGAVEAKNFTHAIAIADDLVARFPAEAAAHRTIASVVRAEILDLEGKAAHDEALRRVNFYEEKYAPRKFENLRKQVLLAFGAHRAKDWNYPRLVPIYGELLKRYGEDVEVLRATMDVMGHEAPNGPTREALFAAVYLMQGTDAPIDKATADLIFLFLERRANNMFARDAVKYRKLLLERYPGVVADAEARLDGTCSARAHPFLLLRDLDKLSAKARLRFYYTILHDDCRGINNFKAVLQDAIAYVEANASRSDWSALKRDAGIAPVEEIRWLRRGGFFARPAAKALLAGFQPEVEQALLSAVGKRGDPHSDEDMRRTNAWEMLKLVGLSDRVDARAFHRDTLLTYGGRFKPRLVGEAIDYFARQGDNDDARNVLIATREYLADRIATYKKRTGYEPSPFLSEYLVDVEAALAGK